LIDNHTIGTGRVSGFEPALLIAIWAMQSREDSEIEGFEE
jgi:hypothetical protein